MAEVHLRKRRRLKRKEIAAHRDSIERQLGVRLFDEDEAVDAAEVLGKTVILFDGVVVAIVLGERTFPTVRGLLRQLPSRRHVTVDMGAVPFIYNGADVMAPGIVDADRAIEPGDLVWIRDERNMRPLAIGESLLSGPDMVAHEKGKAVKSMHHVGDALWKLDEPATS